MISNTKVITTAKWRKRYLHILENGPRLFGDISHDVAELELEIERDLLRDLKDGGFIECDLFLEGKFEFERTTMDGLIFASSLKRDIYQDSFQASAARVIHYVLGVVTAVLGAYIIHLITK